MTFSAKMPRKIAITASPPFGRFRGQLVALERQQRLRQLDNCLRRLRPLNRRNQRLLRPLVLFPRHRVTSCYPALHNYSRRIKRNDNYKFHYILITEKHKNGAFHFHGLFSDLLSTDIYTNQYGYTSSHFFDEQLGFCSFSPIKDILKCANYITKYITKDCIKNEHNQIYICSKGLLRAEVYDLPARNLLPNYNINENFWTYSNDYTP